MSWTMHNFSLHCIVAYKTCIHFILGQSLHVHAFQNSCFTSGYESIDFSLNTNFQNPIPWFKGLSILCSFHRTQRPLLYVSKDYNVFFFTFPRTSMSSVFYAFKDYNVFQFMIPRLQCLLLHDFKDFNVFSLLHSKDFNVFSLFLFKDFNIFSLLHLKDLNVICLLQRLQYLPSYVLQDYDVFCLMLLIFQCQCPLAFLVSLPLFSLASDFE